MNKKIEKVKPYDIRKALSYGGKYSPVMIERVYPNGSVGILNAFKDENSACFGGDPAWPREKLEAYASKIMHQWIETYWWALGHLRLVK